MMAPLIAERQIRQIHTVRQGHETTLEVKLTKDLNHPSKLFPFLGLYPCPYYRVS
jgi:hypothetical protein